MDTNNTPATIIIDGQSISVTEGLTILEAAKRNNIHIPTLCHHPTLTPFGGCRLCMVGIEGINGYPTACTTPTTNGMVIHTDTESIRMLRREILKLILSEHPSNCLFCGEVGECELYMNTLRKGETITGCRSCAKDGQCELQALVDEFELTNLDLPVHYRNLPLENYDPFYDRDYNLCILCGRCVRACQDVRLAEVLTFKQRGHDTLVGPAFDRSHLEAGCEFCGACVDVCPTGTLLEKIRKWVDKPERMVTTTCPLCGIGCQVQLLVKGNEVIGSLPADDPTLNHGQLCVKGRFSITELVNNVDRLKIPYHIKDSHTYTLTLDDAVKIAAEQISLCPPQQFHMLVSANMTNEDLYIAQKFTRTVAGSSHIETPAIAFYGNGVNAYLDLMKFSIPFTEIKKADVILTIGLDTRYGRSVVGVELKQAQKNGASLITIHPDPHSLTRIAEFWVKTTHENELFVFNNLAKIIGTLSSPVVETGGELSQIARNLKEAERPVILIGSEYLRHEQSAQILEAIGQIAENVHAGVLILPAHNNLLGALLMGCNPEIPEDAHSKPGLLYCIGEGGLESIPSNSYVIYQNCFASGAQQKPDLVLPSAAFTETDGTVISGDGRVRYIRKAVNPPGNTLPDWKILCLIAQRMGKKGFDFTDAQEIYAEIRKNIKGWGDESIKDYQTVSLPQLLHINPIYNTVPGSTTSHLEHTYRGFPLTTWVDGLKDLDFKG